MHICLQLKTSILYNEFVTNCQHLFSKAHLMMLPIFSNILGTVGQMQSVDAAEATHYKYTGEFSGAAEWTPADTNYLVNTSVIVPPDTNSAAYWSAYGKPDHEMRYLYDLTGYAQIEQIHMRYMDTATKSEIDELETLLKSGVIF